MRSANDLRVGLVERVVGCVFHRLGRVTGRIGATRSLGNRKDTVLREYMIVDEQLLLMPSNYDFFQASALACAAVTTWE